MIYNKKYYTIHNLLFLLLASLPLFLVTGPFIPELIVFFFNLFFFFNLKKNKNFHQTKEIKVLFLFYIYIVILSFFSIEKLSSLQSAVFYFRFIIFSLVIAYLLNNIKNSLDIFLKIFLFSLLFVLFDSLYQFFVGNDFFGLESGHHSRVSGPFGDELILGSYLSRFCPFLLMSYFYFLAKKKKIYSNLSLFIYFFGFLLTLLSSERTASAVYIISIFFYLIINRHGIFKKLAILVLFVTIIISVLQNPQTKNRLISSTVLNSASGTYIFSIVHHSHYTTAFKMFKNNIFFGVGPKMFRFECSNSKYKTNIHSCSTHPHNFLMQILSETGIFGFFFYIFVLIGIFFEFLKLLFLRIQTKKIDIRIFMIYAILINLSPLWPTGNIFNNWLSIVFYIPLGFYFYFKYYRILKI